MENVSAVNEIIEVITADSSARAPSGPPPNRNGRSDVRSSNRSISVRPTPRADAASAHSAGMSQNRSRAHAAARTPPPPASCVIEDE
jgi:hypothetical protein